MGFLDGLLKQAMSGQGGGSAMSGLVNTVTKNPQILGALGSLLSTRDPGVGGSGGLGGLVSTFQKKGLGNMISSWISTGPNPAISAAQVTDVLGGDTVGQFAKKAGVPVAEAGSVLAGLLPALIDHLTPDGKVPETNTLEVISKPRAAPGSQGVTSSKRGFEMTSREQFGCVGLRAGALDLRKDPS